MLKVTCEVTDYSDPAKASMRVNSDWNDPRFVELRIGNEVRRVYAADLKSAVDNASNTNRHG